MSNITTSASITSQVGTPYSALPIVPIPDTSIDPSSIVPYAPLIGTQEFAPSSITKTTSDTPTTTPPDSQSAGPFRYAPPDASPATTPNFGSPSQDAAAGAIPSITTSTDRYGRLTVIRVSSTQSSSSRSSTSISSRSSSATINGINGFTSGATILRGGMKKGVIILGLALSVVVAELWV